MKKLKVVLTDYEYDSLAIEEEIITAAGAEFVPVQCKGLSDEQIIAAVNDADALLVQYADISRRVIQSLRHCKGIVRYGVGVDSIDIAAAAELGIRVCNVPDYGLKEVADHTVALIMNSLRKITFLDREIRNNKWDYKLAYPIYRLDDQIVGLFGFGNIARIVARNLKHLGFQVIAHDPFVHRIVFQDYGVLPVSFDALLEKSDFVSLHSPLNEHTRHLFNQQAFQKMKSSAYLINTSRGGLVHEDDLIDALRNKIIAGAALDVVAQEPISRENELLKLKNVTLTPHSAFYSLESEQSLKTQAAEEIVRILLDKQPLNQVNNI